MLYRGMENKIKTFLLRLTEDEHQEFKVYCVGNKISMQNFIYNAIAQKVGWPKKK